MPAKIMGIDKNSLAEEIGIQVGDLLYSINGNLIKDIIDYQFYSQDDFLVVEIEKPNREIWEIEIEKAYDEELGLQFEGIVFDRMKVCKNRCIFCFVDQLPPNMRKTLYIKDDDYRYSFLYGNFITLTNLKAEDWDKIINMRLSPLYISVHAMDPDIRVEMLNNPRARTINEDLARLKEAGIEFHTQIVLCPGINDGQVLIDSINKLAGLYPAVLSVGIVPVGLTGFRDNLSSLRIFTKEEAIDVITLINNMQKKFKEKYDNSFVYLADEFFIKANIDFPEAEYYDDYPQIENGIGLARILLDEYRIIENNLPKIVSDREIYIITGFSALAVLEPIIKKLNMIQSLHIKLIPVINNYFGGSVTVTGLLTGSDIIIALGKKYAGKKVILPEIVFKEDAQILLDDMSLTDIIEETGAIIRTVDGSATSLINAIIKDD